ncbi:MAG: hypothetical protein Q9183_003320 [Haloplaca sp. 2 TL-2023]
MARTTHYRSLGASTLLLILSLILYAKLPYIVGQGVVSFSQDGAVNDTIVLPLFDRSAVPLGLRDDLEHFKTATVVNSSEEDWLEKRQQRLTWQEALDKGAAGLARLNGPRQQSQWTTMQQLTDNGWRVRDTSPDLASNDYFGGAGGPYNTLHIRQGAGYTVEAKQDKKFRNCRGRFTPRTEGIYEQIFNPRGRTMVNTFNYSPMYKAKRQQDRIQNRDVPPQDMIYYVPSIYKWSDVIGILWAEQARRSNVLPNTLKYFFRHNVATPDTQQIIEGAAGNPFGAKWKGRWPGKRFAKGTPQFQALLGTPHGKSITWLIVEHPNEFPKKDIESITIFTIPDITGEQYCILFTLTD